MNGENESMKTLLHYSLYNFPFFDTLPTHSFASVLSAHAEEYLQLQVGKLLYTENMHTPYQKPVQCL